MGMAGTRQYMCESFVATPTSIDTNFTPSCLYSQKIQRGIKFGGLAVFFRNHQISANNSYLHMGKFSRGSILADGPSLQFCGSNFCGRVHSHPLCTVQSSLGLIFVVRRIIRKIRPLKNFLLYGIYSSSQKKLMFRFYDHFYVYMLRFITVPHSMCACTSTFKRTLNWQA